MGRVLPFPQVAVIRGTHGTAACTKISREILSRVTRGRAIASAAAASSGTAWAVASRRAREGVTIVAARASRASERVGSGVRGKLGTNYPGTVTREEGEVSGLGRQVVQPRALDSQIRRVTANKIRPSEGRDSGIVAEGQAGLHTVVGVNSSKVAKTGKE